MKSIAIALFVPLLLMGVAQAQPACPAASGGVELKAATASPELEPARLLLDKPVTVSLHPGNDVRFVVAPEKHGDASSFGGMLVVDVREAGSYRIALSAGAWIDVLKDGAAIASSAHDHGAGCKMVSFSLQQGRHVIQLSGNKQETIEVLVGRE